MGIIKTLGRLLLLMAIGLGGACSNKTENHSTAKKNDTNSAGKLEKVNKEKPNHENVVGFFENYAQNNKETLVVVKTSFGNIKIRLFENTPLHRANFIYLVKNKYFDATWFHRVSKGHVIQAGSSDSFETSKKRKQMGTYTLPAEMKEGNFHVRGAVAAARKYKNNPEKRSNPFEFYIALGSTFTSGQLELMEKKYNTNYNSQQIQTYTKTGGSPHLDGEHTVFGEVVEGMDVVEAISKVDVDSGEWPLINIPITVEVLR